MPEAVRPHFYNSVFVTLEPGQSQIPLLSSGRLRAAYRVKTGDFSVIEKIPNLSSSDFFAYIANVRTLLNEPDRLCLSHSPQGIFLYPPPNERTAVRLDFISHQEDSFRTLDVEAEMRKLKNTGGRKMKASDLTPAVQLLGRRERLRECIEILMGKPNTLQFSLVSVRFDSAGGVLVEREAALDMLRGEERRVTEELEKLGVDLTQA